MNIKQIILEEIRNKGRIFFRAVPKYLGDVVVFHPEGYYEGITGDDEPLYKYDTFFVSDVPETAASKYVGGAVLGASSMFKYHQQLKSNTILYIYGISERPDKDISHWTLQDFEYLQEVRYRRPVEGKYMGKILVTQEMVDTFNSFYNYTSLDDYYEEMDEDSEEYKDIMKMHEMIESGEFQRFLDRITV